MQKSVIAIIVMSLLTLGLFANSTGRTIAEETINIQMGDKTDYHEIPRNNGEHQYDWFYTDVFVTMKISTYDNETQVMCVVYTKSGTVYMSFSENGVVTSKQTRESVALRNLPDYYLNLGRYIYSYNGTIVSTEKL